MTRVEEQIHAAMADAERSAEIHAHRITTLRKKLKRCTHSAAVDYQWEHDNGYGRQTMITGKRCPTCLAEFPWGTAGVY